MKTSISWVLLAFALLLTLAASAGTSDKTKEKEKDTPAATATPSPNVQDDMRLEGEKRFHSNCGRCHAAPPKFSPRVMATIVRHMRVRATITDEDTRYILHYMTR